LSHWIRNNIIISFFHFVIVIFLPFAVTYISHHIKRELGTLIHSLSCLSHPFFSFICLLLLFFFYFLMQESNPFIQSMHAESYDIRYTSCCPSFVQQKYISGNFTGASLKYSSFIYHSYCDRCSQNNEVNLSFSLIVDTSSLLMERKIIHRYSSMPSSR